MTLRQHVAWVSVGQFSPRLAVGGARSSLTRLQFLQTRGHPVSILNFLPSDLDREAYAEDLATYGGKQIGWDDTTCRAVFQGVNYCHEILPVDRTRLASQHLPAVAAVQRWLQQKDVNYVFTTDEGYWPLLAAWQLRIPGAHFFHALSGVKRFARNPGYVWLLRRRTVVANSRFMQGEIKTRLDLNATIWYPFVDLNAYRCRWQDSERTNRIGFYSTGKSKGSAIVAEIATRMPEREFLVVGAYGEEPASNLVCLGHIQDMRRFYREIDLLLVPSMVEEAFGRVILEAAANGIPSIANRVGGIPEALKDSGVLVEWKPGTDAAETAGEYVAAIRTLLDDAEAYCLHSQKALARADAYEKEQNLTSLAFCNRYLCG